MNVAVILAAGNSNRFKDTTPKQFQKFDFLKRVVYETAAYENFKIMDKDESGSAV